MCRAAIIQEFVPRRPHVFCARQLQLGEFFGRRERRRFECGLAIRSERAGLSRDGTLRGSGFGGDGFPDLVGVNLGLAQGDEIVGDGFLAVEAEMLGVGANESFVEDAAGKQVEVFFLDGLKHARADLGDV